MATERSELELASGRSEITAPFHQTAQRRRNQHEPTAVPGEPPAAEQVIVDVPLAASMSEPQVAETHPRIGPPLGIAFVAALLVLAAMWWVMLQRLPDVGSPEIIRRNLSDAQQAMAEGRHADPPERSALHYYTAVLALDPNNAQAITGIDAIADRHLTDARVLLADQSLAEAGVALEKARRVRPDHSGLLALDTLLRVELRRILASSSALDAKPVEEIVKPPTARPRADASLVRSRATRTLPPALVATAARSEATLETSAPKLTNALAESVAAAAPRAALSRADQTSTFGEPNAPAAEPRVANDNMAGSEANIEEPTAVAAAASSVPESTPPAAPSVEPRLIKMVQPEYPQEASIRGIEGWVDVSLQVTAAGDVVAPRIEETSRGRLFNRAALVAVQQWKYEPRTGGAPTERVRVRLEFRQSN